MCMLCWRLLASSGLGIPADCLGAVCRYRTAWRLGQVGVPDDDPYKKMYDIGQDRAKAKVNKSGNLLFHGESARSRVLYTFQELF